MANAEGDDDVEDAEPQDQNTVEPQDGADEAREMND